jgi:hypothetical protein
LILLSRGALFRRIRGAWQGNSGIREDVRLKSSEREGINIEKGAAKANPVASLSVQSSCEDFLQ